MSPAGEQKGTEQPISEEELLELGTQLDKHKCELEKALQLLKILDKKQVTAQLLIDTKIGKRLTAVNEKSGTDVQVQEKVVEMKNYLK